ncbi:myosin-11 isoform X2 [Brachypodium distachyon]|uniref:myosin-11 isoform X2 n=1 Tax=Brachypodium distachyon TaxID=15368 RepID=UPI000D0DF0FE|nr:myosin-11 isoform X2 [Brachypodium distachyon]|eukprot:XP_024317725.1 myosin-11 isoform X2 [Brachypodium distachyon]
MDASFSAPESHQNSNSGDGTTNREVPSPRDNSNEGSLMGRQDSASYASHDYADHGDDSSRSILDTAEETTEDGKKMLERHSGNFKIETETVKNECADKPKQQAEIALELSASYSEQDSLRQEMEELKSSLGEVTAHQTIAGTPKSGGAIVLQNEVIDEVQFLKLSNANLTAQLSKTQEANIELVSILQELEETIEIQRVEMSKVPHMNDVVDHEVSKSDLTVQEAAELARMLSLKEDEITFLREKLDRILNIEKVDGARPDAIYLELEKENDFLKVKIQELENEFSELTEENLKLIYKLKEVNGVGKGEDPCISNSEEMSSVERSTSNVKDLERKCADLELNLLNFRTEFNGLEENFQKSQEELKERTLELSEMREKLFHATELEGLESGSARRDQLGSGEPDDTETDLDLMKHSVLLKEQEIEGLLHSAKEMENIISDIQKEKNQLEEERLAASLKESSMTLKSLDEVREDLIVLTSSLDSHVSANKVLENKISELESSKIGLESHVSKLENENIELSEFISELEAQLTSLTSENESTKLQMDDYRSLIINLKDEVDQQQAEMGSQKLHVSKLEHENVELSEFIFEMEAQLTSLTSEIESTKLQMDDSRSLITNLKDKVEQQQAEMEAQKLHVSKLEDENIELANFISELEAQLTSLTNENESTKLQMDDSRSLITNLKDKVEQQQAEMEAQKLHASKLEHENIELSKLISELEAQLTSMTSENESNKEMDDSGSLITNLKDQVEQQQAEMEAQKLLVSKLEHENIELSKLISELEARLTSLTSENESSKQLDDSGSLVTNLKDQVEQQQAEMEAQKLLVSKLEHENIELSKLISELEAQLTSLTSENEPTKLQMDNSGSLSTNIKDKVEQQQAEMEAQKLHVSKLAHENIELSKLISELEAQLTSLTSENESTKLQMDDSGSLITNLKDKVEQQQAEMEAQKLHLSKLEHENIELSKVISELEAQLTSLTSENESTKLQMDDSGSLVINLNYKVEQQYAEMEAQKLHVSKLEHENIELSRFISELEAQLTSLTSENDSTKLQMDNSRSLITNLKDKVEQQHAEMESQMLELKQKYLESQRRLSEVQEDSEALRRSNSKLQATADSVVEECNSLQTLTADLKMQKLELHGRSTQLEQELDQSKRKMMDFCKTVEFLEAKLSSLQKEITSKEQSLLAELENIFQEHKEHEERITRAHFLLNKIENEKIAEVKNLEREVMSLTAQVSSTDGERGSADLDSIHEVSILRADKANLEDANAQMRHYESQLEDLHKESKTKIKGMADSLNASKQNEGMLTTDVEHMRGLMEAARSNEESLRKTSDELELRYKSSDYEKQQIMEEICGLKIQVNKMTSLQDEVFNLKSSLEQAKFEKGKLEEHLQSLSEECEEVKTQKAMLTDKLSYLQSTLHDAGDENHSKSMQEKLIINQGNDDVANGNGSTPVNEDPDIQSKIQLLETRLAEALEENKLYRAQLQSPTEEGQSSNRDEMDNNGNSKIAQLESELNDMQERLLTVSMQYAEVEAQREELVMELKNANAKKGRWF